MKPMIDVKYINPFLQSSISIVKSVTGLDLVVGKPEKTDLKIRERTYVIQLGIVGEMKGQVVLGLVDEKAKAMASKMMFGMPVETLDDMASSALNELSNMIMGNTATIFSTLGILIDITPPIAVYGQDIQLKTDIEGLKVPLTVDGETWITLYICTYMDK